jgi:hypothetical protein
MGWGCLGWDLVRIIGLVGLDFSALGRWYGPFLRLKARQCTGTSCSAEPDLILSFGASTRTYHAYNTRHEGILMRNRRFA